MGMRGRNKIENRYLEKKNGSTPFSGLSCYAVANACG